MFDIRLPNSATLLLFGPNRVNPLGGIILSDLSLLLPVAAHFYAITFSANFFEVKTGVSSDCFKQTEPNAKHRPPSSSNLIIQSSKAPKQI